MVTLAMSHECSRSVRVRSAGLTESNFDGPSKPAMVGDIGVSGSGNPISSIKAGGLLDVGAASTVCTLMLNPAVLHRVLRVKSILNER